MKHLSISVVILQNIVCLSRGIRTNPCMILQPLAPSSHNCKSSYYQHDASTCFLFNSNSLFSGDSSDRLICSLFNLKTLSLLAPPLLHKLKLSDINKLGRDKCGCSVCDLMCTACVCVSCSCNSKNNIESTVGEHECLYKSFSHTSPLFRVCLSSSVEMSTFHKCENEPNTLSSADITKEIDVNMDTSHHDGDRDKCKISIGDTGICMVDNCDSDSSDAFDNEGVNLIKEDSYKSTNTSVDSIEPDTLEVSKSNLCGNTNGDHLKEVDMKRDENMESDIALIKACPDNSNAGATCNVDVVDDCDNANEGQKLLDIDVDEDIHSSTSVCDNVYNLSSLFNGELERRRKREMKKDLRNKKRFKKSHKKFDHSLDDRDNDEASEKIVKRKVPNYFVALQIKDSKIKSTLQEVQDSIISKNKQLTPAVTKVTKLHITLMVLCLETEDDMKRSQIALQNAAEKLLPLYKASPLVLDISGLGHFKNQVVFAKVKNEDQLASLTNIASIVEESFLDQEIVSPDKRGFKPHATIMKLSQMKGWQKKGLKKIDSSLYEDYVNRDFGSDTVTLLQLCAMGKPKDKQGYYHVEHTTVFGMVSSNDESNTSLSSSTDTCMADTGIDNGAAIKKDSSSKRCEMTVDDSDNFDIVAKDGDDSMLNVDMDSNSEKQDSKIN
ncbi:positive regulation of delayed rectifier potassium channel [Mactra antiquata]